MFIQKFKLEVSINEDNKTTVNSKVQLWYSCEEILASLHWY